jgi:pyruvate dehydrogenase E2 component (dihydrolipoamide acetyltransferase)
MPIEITVPRLGWSMEEGTFIGWLKQNGDAVCVGEPLFAMESEKVTLDVESLDNGILYVPSGAPVPGTIVVVGQCLGFLLAPGEPAPEMLTAGQTTAGSLLESAVSTQGPSALAKTPARDGRAPVTPRARRVAAELGIDTTLLRGSGRGGRIREADVRAASSLVAQAGAIPITTRRRSIARHMMESRQNTAPVTLTSRADVTALCPAYPVETRTGSRTGTVLQRHRCQACRHCPRKPPRSRRALGGRPYRTVGEGAYWNRGRYPGRLAGPGAS